MPNEIKRERIGVKQNLIHILFGGVVDPIARYLHRRMHTVREIARDVWITEHWTELKPDKPMRIERKLQDISLRIENCRMDMEKPGLILSNGTIVNPEIQIVDEFGVSYTLSSGSYGVGDIDLDSETMAVHRAGYAGKLPGDRVYSTVLVRSDKPFRCSRVLWRNYNLK